MRLLARTLVISAGAATLSPMTKPIASSPLVVARETLTSFVVVGTTCFGGRSIGALCNRQALQPALLSGLRSARRWGGVSAGFSGGRALGQLVRKCDDVYCAMLGACLAGAAGATSVDQIPMRVLAFTTMAIVLDGAQKRSGSLLPGLAPSTTPARPRRRDAGPGQVPSSLGNPYGIRVLPPEEANQKVWREVSELYPWLRWFAERGGSAQSNKRKAAG